MPHKLSKADNGKVVEVSVGETVEVELPSNPTTGHSWMFENRTKEGPKSKAFTVKSEYVAPKAQMLGAGGNEVFKVTAHQPGVHEVTLVYMRPWLGPQHNSERFTVKLNAK